MMDNSTFPRVLICNAAIVTAQGPERGPLRQWAELGFLPRGEVIIARHGAGWLTEWLGPAGDSARPAYDAAIDLGGRLLLPGWIDCHTHAVFAGDRSHEFGERLAGRSYSEIAAAGGGILHTVAATRAAPLEALVEASAPRLAELAAWGVQVVEIKTGYGLDVATELKTLAAMARLQERFAGQLQLVATAMPAHAVAPEFAGRAEAYAAHVAAEILPALVQAELRPRFCDIFVERGFFDLAAAEVVWQGARRLGLRLKAHVDELSALGGLGWAVAHGAVSVEHLLCTDAFGVARLAASDTVAVCLPLTSLFLREPLAPLRALVDAGARVAVATDCNPGSAMTTNLPLAMQLAVLQGRLTPPEAVRSVTRNAALALGEPGGVRGTIAEGAPWCATLLDLAHPDELFYALASPPRASGILRAALAA